MQYLAHIREGPYAEQTIKAHLEGAAQLAEAFADAFGAGELGRYCGLFHDAGKYCPEFQQRIRGKRIKADHMTAGAQEAERLAPPFGRIAAYCIAGHHGGLPACGCSGDPEEQSSLHGRLKRVPSDYSAFPLEISQPHPPAPPPLRITGTGGFTCSFFTRMLYSCLVDADFLDTEFFMRGGETGRAGTYDLAPLAQKLRAATAKFTGDKPINAKRCEILQSCLAAAPGERGLYSLTVPTGGGKTISSLAFALEHALKNGLSRIIYVIPYTSIIEQNAAVFSDLLGAENVLQHHSNFDFSDDEDGILRRQKLAAENWDAPLIATTNVQFFESLFANKPSRCRKLHNIANSVLIFDEAQMFPVEFLKPCVRAITELVQNNRCTAVLCSATQPALEPFFPPELPIREICPDTAGLYDFFRRTRLVFRGELSNAELLRELQQEPQVLCIVSTRAHARALFAGLSGEGNFHLSTAMYPAHRKRSIDEIKRRLALGLPCRVVSTQLIEAGVDVDFPVVYRSVAGLDSLVQSAGRCNREGRFALRDVYVFEPESAFASRLPHQLIRPAQVARGALRRFTDPLSPEAIRSYFCELYEMAGPQGLDTNDICKSLEAGVLLGNRNRQTELAFDFPKIAERFKLIADDTQSILIPNTPESRLLATRLRTEGPSRGLMRRIQPYSVAVRLPSYRALRNRGAIETTEEAAILLEGSLYDEALGLTVPGDEGVAIIL